MRIEHSVVINRPIEGVFAFVSDIEKLPQWAAEIVEVKIVSEGPVGVGTTFSDVVKEFGRRIEATLEVTEYEPNSKLTFKAIAGPIPVEVRHIFEAVEGGTKVTLVQKAEVGGFFKLAEPLLARMAQRQTETDLSNLKNLLEAGA